MTGKVYKVNPDDFTDPSGRYFDFGLVNEAIEAGKIEPISEHPMEDGFLQEAFEAGKTIEPVRVTKEGELLLYLKNAIEKATKGYIFDDLDEKESK